MSSFRLSFLLLLLPSFLWASDPIQLMGANGRQVSFAGIKEAQPNGLVLMLSEDAGEVFVSWDSFDMLYMEESQRDIYEAAIDAQTYKKTVPIYKGVYEQYLTYDTALQGLAEGMYKKIKAPVPTYDEFLIAYGRMYQRSNQNYMEYVEEKSKVLEDYQGFINSLFKNNKIKLNIVRSSFYGTIHSAEPNKKEVALSSVDLITFLSQDKNHYRSEAMVYVRNHPEVIKQPLKVLQDLQKQVPSPLFDKSDADQIYFETLIENSIRELEHLKSERTFPHSAMRNFQTLLDAIHEGQEKRKG